MRQVILTEQACEDLAQIGDYLMEHNPAAAIRLMKLFRKKFDLLAVFPKLGVERNGILLGLRCLFVKEYLILYQPGDAVIEILRVRHNARSQDDLFQL